MEFLKDNDCVINYHPGKANVVADALSRKSIGMLMAINASLEFINKNVVLAELRVRPNLIQQVLKAQEIDEKILEWL